MFRRVQILYEDIYSALYEWNLRRWNGDDYMASWMTACGLAGAVIMNLVLASGIFVLNQGPDVLSTLSLGWLLDSAWIAIVILILLAHYAAFVWQDRYERVIRRFEEREPAHRRRVTIVAWSYVFASYLSPILLSLVLVTKYQ